MIHLGDHPDEGLPVYAIRSPFGGYIQCGEPTDDRPRPRGCWLPSGWDITDLSLDSALELLSFPRTLGQHPVTGADVTIHLQHSGATIRSEIMINGQQKHAVTRLEPQDETLSFNLERAVQLLDRISDRK